MKKGKKREGRRANSQEHLHETGGDNYYGLGGKEVSPGVWEIMEEE